MCSNYLRLGSNEAKLTSTRQRNYYSPFTRKREKQFYRNLDIKDVIDKNTFWKTIKPLFPDRTKSSNTMILLEKDKVVTDNGEIAKRLNSSLEIYYKDFYKSLEIPESENIDQRYEQIQTPTLKAIVKFRKHPNIKAINNSFANRSFCFCIIKEKDVSSEINKLNPFKALHDTDIP